MESVRAAEDTIISGVARDNDGQVTRVEITVVDLASGIELNDGPDPITTFQPNGAWMVYWDTSDLIHDQQYELQVKAYDGEDYSITQSVRIVIDNPADADNIKPTFNPDGWVESFTIFCDEKSSALDKCGKAEINLLDFFNDSDGVGPETSHMIFDIFDDPSTAIDDEYGAHIRITPDGMAIYNPMESIYRTTPDILEWSLLGVTFEARDIHDSSVYSYQVDFIVRGVEFTVNRVDSGSIKSGDDAEFTGTGLPGEQVYARLLKGKLPLNNTIIGDDGIWSMTISSTDLPQDDGSYDIYFESQGQYIGKDDDISISLRKGDESAGGVPTWVWVVVAIVAIAILLAVAAFFFLEFEEEFEEDEEAAMEQQKQEDPYAWAKARAAEQAATAGELAPAPAPVPAAQPQHPGWIWDAQSNQWVADPNYRPPQQ